MSIITKPATILKGTPATFTLNKADLAQVPSVAADVSYFADSTNWKKVRVSYVSSTGNQSEVVLFDATEANPSGQFLASLKARSEFQIKHITIEDFDGGVFKINRSELVDPENEFDISFSPAAPTPIFTRTFNTAKELWESSGPYDVFNADHLLLSNATMYTALYGFDSWSSQPKPLSFVQNALYRVEVDFYDVTSADVTINWDIGGPYNIVSISTTETSGTLVANNVPLAEQGDDALYVQFSNNNSSIKISEIRVYEE